MLLVDTGNSYEGLCGLINRKTKGADGIYFTYTDARPIAFNPFYTDDYVFDVEKRESICTLLLTLWKSADEPVTKTEAKRCHPFLPRALRRALKNHVFGPPHNHRSLIIASSLIVAPRGIQQFNNNHHPTFRSKAPATPR